jgi:hypothetical protein
LIGRIRIQEGKNENKNRKKGRMSSFDVLDVIFRMLKASPVA